MTRAISDTFQTPVAADVRPVTASPAAAVLGATAKIADVVTEYRNESIVKDTREELAAIDALEESGSEFVDPDAEKFYTTGDSNYLESVNTKIRMLNAGEVSGAISSSVAEVRRSDTLRQAKSNYPHLAAEWNKLAQLNTASGRSAPSITSSIEEARQKAISSLVEDSLLTGRTVPEIVYANGVLKNKQINDAIYEQKVRQGQFSGHALTVDYEKSEATKSNVELVTYFLTVDKNGGVDSETGEKLNATDLNNVVHTQYNRSRRWLEDRRQQLLSAGIVPDDAAFNRVRERIDKEEKYWMDRVADNTYLKIAKRKIDEQSLADITVQMEADPVYRQAMSLTGGDPEKAGELVLRVTSAYEKISRLGTHKKPWDEIENTLRNLAENDDPNALTALINLNLYKSLHYWVTRGALVVGGQQGDPTAHDPAARTTNYVLNLSILEDPSVSAESVAGMVRYNLTRPEEQGKNLKALVKPERADNVKRSPEALRIVRRAWEDVMVRGIDSVRTSLPAKGEGPWILGYKRNTGEFGWTQDQDYINQQDPEYIVPSPPGTTGTAIEFLNTALKIQSIYEFDYNGSMERDVLAQAILSRALAPVPETAPVGERVGQTSQIVREGLFVDPIEAEIPHTPNDPTGLPTEVEKQAFREEVDVQGRVRDRRVDTDQRQAVAERRKQIPQVGQAIGDALGEVVRDRDGEQFIEGPPTTTGPGSAKPLIEGRGTGVMERQIASENPERDAKVSRGGNTLFGEIMDELKREEGVRLKVYKDDVGNATLGVGHLVTKDTPAILQALFNFSADEAKAVIDGNKSLTKDQADKLLQNDIQKRMPQLKKLVPNIENLSPKLQVRLMSALFRGSLAGSPATLALINGGQFKKAAIEFLDNREYRRRKAKGRDGVVKRMEATAKALAEEA